MNYKSTTIIASNGNLNIIVEGRILPGRQAREYLRRLTDNVGVNSTNQNRLCYNLNENKQSPGEN